MGLLASVQRLRVREAIQMRLRRERGSKVVGWRSAGLVMVRADG